jgi:lipopolysaccharide export LptBFGC system permease protein LptF
MIFGQKNKLRIITIIKYHNSKHYIHSIFINTYDNTNELNVAQKENNIDE